MPPSPPPTVTVTGNTPAPVYGWLSAQDGVVDAGVDDVVPSPQSNVHVHASAPGSVIPTCVCTVAPASGTIAGVPDMAAVGATFFTFRCSVSVVTCAGVALSVAVSVSV